MFETKSGPGAPDTPAQPQLTNRSAHSVALAWNEPPSNGAAIVEYRLEVAHQQPSSRKNSSSASSLAEASSATEEAALNALVDIEQLIFSASYSGPARQHEVKGLNPSTVYYFRVQAVNAAGSSPFSCVSSFTTLASSPAAVSNLRCTAVDASSLSLSWNAPHCNGSPVLFYNVEVSDKGVYCTSDPVTTFDVVHLTPNTQYRYARPLSGPDIGGLFIQHVSCYFFITVLFRIT